MQYVGNNNKGEKHMITDGFIKPNGEEVFVRSSKHMEFAKKWIEET